jgi:ATP-dependent DNA helicase RecG
MYYVRDIESFGTGLKRITDACDSAGVKVEFKMLKLGFAVIFYRPDGDLNDLDRNSCGVSCGINGGVNENQRRIIEIMISEPTITVQGIAASIDVPKRTVEYAIKKLKDSGIVKRVGAAKNGHWVVKS